MRFLSSILLLFLILTINCSALAGRSKLSLLDSVETNEWINQDSQRVVFKNIGEKQKIAFILSYTTCKTLCPMIANDLKLILNKFNTLQIFLISIRPSEDTPNNLKQYLNKQKLTNDRVHFILNTEKNTRELTKKLGLYYGQTDVDGHLDHSTNIVFVNKKSIILGVVSLDNGLDKKNLKLIEDFISK